MSTPAVRLTLQANGPQLFTVDGKYVLGIHADGTYIGKPGIVPVSGMAPIIALSDEGFSTTPVKPGESIVVFGTGLGPTSPALIPGQVPGEAANLVTLPQVTIGGAP